MYFIIIIINRIILRLLSVLFEILIFISVINSLKIRIINY